MTTSSNWARRYGPNHRRLCARPGCGAPAAATLRFQPTRREAWLVDLDDDGARTEGDLCARHAAGLVLPRGWQLHNGRTATGNEGAGPTPPAPRPRRPAVARVARRRRVVPGTVELPGLSVVPAPEPAADPDPPAEPKALLTVAPEPSASAPGREPGTNLGAPVGSEPAPPVESGPERPEPAPLVAPVSAQESEALAETLDAQTPLLRRAFSNVWLPENDS